MLIKNSKMFVFLLILCSSFALMNGSQAGPLGNSFVVNSYLPDGQVLAGSAASANGDTLFLWSDLSKGSASYLQRYDAVGQPLAISEVFVGNNAGYIASDRVGNYAITTVEPDGSGNGVFATLYSRSGALRVNTFRVNEVTLGDQNGGVIGMDGNGNFAIAWLSFDNGQWNTYVKQYSSSGVARTAAVRINATNTTMYPMGVAMDTSGNVVVSGWANQSGNADVWMRRISPAGALLGSQVVVNTYTTSSQTGGSIAMNSNNSFVVVWNSLGQDGNGWSVYGQSFNSDGSRAGVPFRVSQTLADSEPSAKVGMMDDGSFSVTWQIDNRTSIPSSLPTIYSRQFRNDTTAIASEAVVNSIAGSKAFFPQIAMTPSGNYTIAWRDYNLSNNYDVAGRRFVMDSLPSIIGLNSGQTAMGISGATGSWNYFKINVPSGVRNLNINMTGVGGGDGDLYIRFGALPTLAKWDIRPYLIGSNESVSINSPPTGFFYIGVYGYSAYPSISLTATYN